MDVWVIWLIIAVVLAVAEIFTLTAALGLLGAAALITSVSAMIGLPVPLQLVVFAVTSAVGVIVVRPIAQRHMSAPRSIDFGVDALLGKPAYVLQEVTGRNGRVRIGGHSERYVGDLDDAHGVFVYVLALSHGGARTRFQRALRAWFERRRCFARCARRPEAARRAAPAQPSASNSALAA